MPLFGKKKEAEPEQEHMGIQLLNDILCALNNNGIKYDVNNEKLFVKVIYTSETFDLVTFIHTYSDRSTLAYDCPLDFTVGESANRAAILEKLNEINTNIHYGAFTLEEDRIWYRFHIYPTGVINEENIINSFRMVRKTVDEYDDDLAAIAQKSGSYSGTDRMYQ